MVHGYIIIIKRNGEDGTKYPLTDRELKFGTSAECMVRIHTPGVDSLQCSFHVGDNGQVKLKNLSKKYATLLNSRQVFGDAKLKHQDVIEIGGRLVRWEYPSNSVYRSAVKAKMPETPKAQIGAKTPKERVSSSKISNVRRSLASALKSPQSKTASRVQTSSTSKVQKIYVTGSDKKPSRIPKLGLLAGRHSLQAKKRIFSPMGKRKSGKHDLSEGSFKSSTPNNRIPTPWKTTSVDAKVSNKSPTSRSWSIKTPGLKTIVEGGPNKAYRKSPTGSAIKTPSIVRNNPESSKKTPPKSLRKSPTSKRNTPGSAKTPKSIRKTSEKKSNASGKKTPKSLNKVAALKRSSNSPKKTPKSVTQTPKALNRASLGPKSPNSPKKTPKSVMRTPKTLHRASLGPKSPRSPKKTPKSVTKTPKTLNRASLGPKSPNSPKKTPKTIHRASLGPKSSRSPKKTPKSVTKTPKTLNRASLGPKSPNSPMKTPKSVTKTPKTSNRASLGPKSPVSVKKSPKSLNKLTFVRDGSASPKKTQKNSPKSSGKKTPKILNKVAALNRSPGSPKMTPKSPTVTPNNLIRASLGAEKSPASAKKTPKSLNKTPKSVNKVAALKIFRSSKKTPKRLTKSPQSLKILTMTKGGANMSLVSAKKTPKSLKKAAVSKKTSGRFTNSPSSSRKTPKSLFRASLGAKMSPISAKKTPENQLKSPSSSIKSAVKTPKSPIKTSKVKRSPGSVQKTPKTLIRTSVGSAKKTPKSVFKISLGAKSPASTKKSLHRSSSAKTTPKSIGNTSLKAKMSPASLKTTPVKSPLVNLSISNNSVIISKKRLSTVPNVSPESYKTPMSAKKPLQSFQTPRTDAGSPVYRTNSNKSQTPKEALKLNKTAHNADSVHTYAIRELKHLELSPVSSSKKPPLVKLRGIKSHLSAFDVSPRTAGATHRKSRSPAVGLSPRIHNKRLSSPPSVHRSDNATPLQSSKKQSPKLTSASKRKFSGNDFLGEALQLGIDLLSNNFSLTPVAKTPKMASPNSYKAGGIVTTSGSSPSKMARRSVSSVDKQSPGKSPRSVSKKLRGSLASLSTSDVITSPASVSKSVNSPAKSPKKSLSPTKVAHELSLTSPTVSLRDMFPVRSPTHAAKGSQLSVGKKTAVKESPRKSLGSPAQKLKNTGSSCHKSSRNSFAALAEGPPESMGKKTPSKALSKAIRPAAAKRGKVKTLKLTDKPDKNKKKALLVLGKISQIKVKPNLKLKQKIVKKAIKVSTRRVAATRSVDAKMDTFPSASKGDFSFTKKDSPKKSPIPSIIVTPATPIQTPGSPGRERLRPKIDLASIAKVLPTPKASFSRRSSKRISSKNDMGRPDYYELSPSALGLTPRYLELFRTPKPRGRRSISLVTPKNKPNAGIIKAASTTKKHMRKSVSFSKGTKESDAETSADFTLNMPAIPRDLFDSLLDNTESLQGNVSYLSSISNNSPSETKNEYENDSADLCQRLKKNLLQILSPKKGSNAVSPRKSPGSPLVIMNELAVQEFMGTRDSAKKLSPKSDENSSSINTVFNRAKRRSVSSPVSPSSKKDNVTISKSPKSPSSSSSRNVSLSPKRAKTPGSSKSMLSRISNSLGSPEAGKVTVLYVDENNDRSPKSVDEARRSGRQPKTPNSAIDAVKLRERSSKSPKNDLTNVQGVKLILDAKTPRNDLRDVRGVKRLMKTPKASKLAKLRSSGRPQKSPRNDLTDVKGVSKLLRTPKSPKNDLTSVEGVKLILEKQTPKNDLRKIVGLKRLMKTPRVKKATALKKPQRPLKSPKNDLTDVRGVRELYRTRGSPKNDLTNVEGVKLILEKKTPKNDLRKIRSLKKLMKTPKVKKSTGLKKLGGPPKSPKNDLTDVRGVKELYRTRKSPKNDLTDVKGVKLILEKKTPKNDLRKIRSLKKLMKTPKVKKSTGLKKLVRPPKSPKNDLTDVRGVRELYRTRESPKNDLTNVKGVKLVLEKKTPKNDLRKIRSLKKLMKTPKVKKSTELKKLVRPPKSPKNDLTDVSGVKELFRTPKSPKNDGVELILDAKTTRNDRRNLRLVKRMKTPPASSKAVNPSKGADKRKLVVKRSPSTNKGSPVSHKRKGALKKEAPSARLGRKPAGVSPMEPVKPSRGRKRAVKPVQVAEVTPAKRGQRKAPSPGKKGSAVSPKTKGALKKEAPSARRGRTPVDTTPVKPVKPSRGRKRAVEPVEVTEVTPAKRGRRKSPSPAKKGEVSSPPKRRPTRQAKAVPEVDVSSDARKVRGRAANTGTVSSPARKVPTPKRGKSTDVSVSSSNDTRKVRGRAAKSVAVSSPARKVPAPKRGKSTRSVSSSNDTRKVRGRAAKSVAVSSPARKVPAPKRGKSTRSVSSSKKVSAK